MDDKDKMIINNLIEDKKSLWTVVIVLTGGLVGLVASFNNLTSIFQISFRIFCLLFGLFTWYCMVNNLISVINQINERLKG